LAPHRPFMNWMLLPPSPTGVVDDFLEPASRSLIWKWLELPANDPAEGRKLFAGSLGERNRLWREFHNYVRQAKAYDDAAAAVTGSSSGLLQYYALLNLAKAELLVSNSPQVLTPPFRHGLVFRRSKGDSIAGDALEVQPGAFQLLYQKRTSSSLVTGTRLPVKKLLALVPEIGWEIGRLQFTQSQVGWLVHAAVADKDNVWSVLLVQRSDAILASASSKRRFLEQYEEADLPSDWRDRFGITRRGIIGGFAFFQSCWVRPRVSPTALFGQEYFGVAQQAWSALSGLIDVTTDPSSDALLAPSMLRTRWMPMPPSLARYALMFYLSSLVRYAPAKLDPARQPNQAWLFDSFASEAHVPLLVNALNGISKQPVLFHPRAAQRV
jgi:hypothetical protein